MRPMPAHRSDLHAGSLWKAAAPSWIPQPVPGGTAPGRRGMMRTTRGSHYCVSPAIMVRMQSVTPFSSASISLNGRGGLHT